MRRLGFDAYQRSVAAYTLADAPSASRACRQRRFAELAQAYARADRAVICWTLGITEHHNAVDNVFALINLALLTGKVGRYACGLNPLRGQNNVQGGGDMGAIPDRFPGLPSGDRRCVRARNSSAPGIARFPRGVAGGSTRCSMRSSDGELRDRYVVGENPRGLRSRPQSRTERLLTGSNISSCKISRSPQTARFAHVVLPAAAGWCRDRKAR